MSVGRTLGWIVLLPFALAAVMAGLAGAAWGLVVDLIPALFWQGREFVRNLLRKP